ncbi:MAG: SH3 domain-containing protein [Candidatus Kaiserbacteria bacterium]|nr:SH3 domain-containing protein [Candidatus Kaiserbacteria bacterium]
MTEDGLRVRAERNLSSAVLATLATGQVVDVWCRVEGWWLVQVRESGVTGWAWGEFLAMVATDGSG